jgi:hypothetical protein
VSVVDEGDEDTANQLEKLRLHFGYGVEDTLKCHASAHSEVLKTRAETTAFNITRI